MIDGDYLLTSTVLTLCSELPRGYGNTTADQSGLQTARLSDMRSRNLFHQDRDTSFAFDIPVDTMLDRPSVDTGQGRYLGGKHIQQLSESDNVESSAKTPTSEQKLRPNVQRKPRNSTPSLSAGVVKRLASSLARSSNSTTSRINKEALGAIMQASNWFFEQVGNDLGAYAKHAGRKTIDEMDITMLIKRPVLSLTMHE